MAADLPIEIIQSFLSYLDVETYHSARQTCFSWRSAASVASMLRDVLQQVPVSLPHCTKSLSPKDWNDYFGQVARLNLLGSRSSVEKIVAERKLPHDSSSTTVLAFSSDGRKVVGLKGAQTVVHARESGECLLQFSLASSLYPHWTSVCRALMETRNAGYMPINQRYAKHRIAASSDCSFIAVGLGRVVQVYNLHEHDENGTIATPAEYVLGQTDMVFASSPGDEYEDTDGVVESLEFTDDDTLLRVAIGKETTIHRPTRVRYLGQPSQSPEIPNLAYWRKNLNHVYVDSASLAVTLTGDDEYRSTFRGLRLLPPSFHIHSQHAAQHPIPRSTPSEPAREKGLDRCFVASLQTGHTDSYCIGQITSPPATLPQSVRIHRLFPSIYFRPSDLVPGARTEGPPRLYPPAPSSERSPQSMTYNLCDSVSRWNPINLPSATFSSPLLAASDDRRLLIVYEPGAGHSCCIVDGGSLYVFSMQACTAVYQPAQEPLSPSPSSPSSSPDSHESGSEDSGIGPETIYDRLRMTSANPFNDDRYDPPDIIPCWPFLLDRTSMDLESLHVVRSDAPPSHGGSEGRWYTVTGQSGSEMIQWQFTSG
ncbi:hypothetical protein FE257_007067 [Aspergillus nanangensis]|uniref:F-box domain-containing protein n=1 Tax=Aspergillus nanangensis TaxID=2582783 RepID=A0AAD4CNJ2_ASPNN|nr:hypothetical protein FE257_007067 [Aspergillus nanangensis]